MTNIKGFENYECLPFPGCCEDQMRLVLQLMTMAAAHPALSMLGSGPDKQQVQLSFEPGGKGTDKKPSPGQLQGVSRRNQEPRAANLDHCVREAKWQQRRGMLSRSGARPSTSDVFLN